LLTYLLWGRPSHFVTSAEGQAIQKKVWKETVDLLKREAPDADIKEILLSGASKPASEHSFENS